MDSTLDEGSQTAFYPITIGALYPGIERSLSADILTAKALRGQAYPVCTALVVAGHGIVTDVLNVPTDTVSAQLEHLFKTTAPTGAKVGIVGHPATVRVIFDMLDEHLDGPYVLDLTLSGPSGEDIVNQRTLDALTERLDQPDLVAIRRTDAQLVAGMEIPSLDDAQVAVQRIAQLGACRVLMRCGQIATHFFDADSEPPDYAVDLYYDGDDFALFEAPHLDLNGTHGASSALLVPLLRDLSQGVNLPEALQDAKAYVTEGLRHGQRCNNLDAPNYFWKHMQEISS